jgi:hypothetical protein
VGEPVFRYKTNEYFACKFVVPVIRRFSLLSTQSGHEDAVWSGDHCRFLRKNNENSSS